MAWGARLSRLLVMCCMSTVGLSEPRGSEPPASPLTLRELMGAVLQHNESLQVKTLEVEIGRRRRLAEQGIFEPEFAAGYDHVDSRRQNTTQERASLGYTALYAERNNIYNAGLESLVPTGAKVRLGYVLRDLRNTLQDNAVYGSGFTNGEYASFVGLNVVQPLLKNAGFAATMAGIRLAAAASELAFHEYRKQLMIVLSTAEASYWNLYLAQRQVLALQESVEVAETVLGDNETRLKAGVGSELEVMEARAGLALRRSKLAEAEQLLYEAHNRLTALLLDRIQAAQRRFVAVDEPQTRPRDSTFAETWPVVFDRNPDLVMQRKKLVSENIRLAYAKNQRLPQLDLKGSYGLNGLGASPGESWSYIEEAGYPAWTVGLEFRVPLGGRKPRHDLHAARLRVEQALLSLSELETQIASATDTAVRKVRSTRENLGQHGEVVTFNEDLLRTQLARLEAGKVESRKVLEVEADLLNARNALAEAQVLHQRAALEQEFVQGTLLASRGLEKSQPELESWLTVMLSEGRLDRPLYQRMVREALGVYAPAEGTSPAPGDAPGAFTPGSSEAVPIRTSTQPSP